MTRALLIVDVQNDFTEGGALACVGGAATAAAITEYATAHTDDYAVIIASRDWHDPESDNGGHFATNPDWVNTWPVHCVAGTTGAEYHPNLGADLIDEHLLKGQGAPAYSAFEGITADGRRITSLLAERGVSELDIVGIATDYCVRASALDAVAAGLDVSVRAELCVGVDPASSVRALGELTRAGVRVLA